MGKPDILVSFIVVGNFYFYTYNWAGTLICSLKRIIDLWQKPFILDPLKCQHQLEKQTNFFYKTLPSACLLYSLEKQRTNFWYEKISCGEPPGSILGILKFLIYANGIPQPGESNLSLYADDSWLMYQHRDAKEIETQLNKDFENDWNWFVGNKIRIRFGEDKTKSTLFASKRGIKSARKLNIKYRDIKIKQLSQVKYLGCVLDETLSGEPMTLKALTHTNRKLKLLYGKNKFLTPAPRKMLCNALIQPQFDYACSAWYPNLKEK